MLRRQSALLECALGVFSLEDGALDKGLVGVDQVAVEHLATVRGVEESSGQKTSTRTA